MWKSSQKYIGGSTERENFTFCYRIDGCENIKQLIYRSDIRRLKGMLNEGDDLVLGLFPADFSPLGVFSPHFFSNNENNQTKSNQA